ncbi:exodeoxyribonuclease V subunit gamma [Actinotalea sp. Marseille-Q4924]|uniref:exodeoxyribonuclease V subunit gamma n=1 Tax=Actinotalea sp. Marseille-Q4924 TaxID=2866571 RepID=UPI001CE45CBE|nr:exodeoxyribonuclease V subunit gamma [Actinotalea sp. Marseille-Q4924]
MLHVHRSERADALVPPLAAVLSTPPSDPFAGEVVAVPTRGVERWLAQRLSHHLGATDAEAGICANVSFDSPGRVVAHVLAAVTGVDPETDPWRADRLAWQVLEAIDTCAGEPWCRALGRFVGAGSLAPDTVRQARRLQAAQHLAHLFAGYAAQRPAMLRAWAAGADDDGAGSPVPDDLAWQPRLWRHVRDAVGAPGPAEALEDALVLLRERPAAVDLPERISLFGATRLPEHHLQVLAALAAHRDVHLWLPHPSPTLWERVTALPPDPVRRSALPGAAAHPLLASMARDATELQLRLATWAVRAEHHAAPSAPPTLLGALQDALHHDDPGAPAHPLAPDDRSVQVHACHGRARQVEVLREALLGLFAADPTLEPRDVVVLCPDVETFAPLVAATFGVAPSDLPSDDGEGAWVHPGRALRIRLADRSLRQTNPLLSLVSRLLELADDRVTASQVLDLAASEPVRRRFSFDDDDVDRLRSWAAEAGARWGEDHERRRRFGVGAVAQGTWDAALDRILLGAAMAEEDQRYVGTALPLDDVDSTDVDLAGRLAEVLDRLTAVLADLSGTHPPAHWFDALDRALDLLADVSPADAWQTVQARSVLDDARRSAAEHATTALGLGDVRALLARRLQGRPTRTGFRTGALTVCSLEPMRAVPHRVVCLLGMDDGAFPRGSSADGDDVLLRDPLVGERDRRAEDRQLFLDAVTAAGEHLVVLHSGADERTGAARPPAVPVSELLDALDLAAAAPDGRPVREHVVVRHPLQTVDERNFSAGSLGAPGPFSFDALTHAAALTARRGDPERPPFLRAPLPAPGDPGSVDLEDLVRALEHPVRTFVRQRLGVTLPGEVDEVDDRIPLELDGLEKWQIGDRLLAAALDGGDLDRAVQAEWRRGTAPPRALGGAVLTQMREQVEPILEATSHHVRAAARTVDVTAGLPDGRELTGTVTGVRGDALVRTVFSRLAAKHRLRAWVQLLALSAGEPAASWTAVTIGRGPGTSARAAVSVLTAPDGPTARELLGELVALRDAALREPLPLPVKATCAYARSRHAHEEVGQALDGADRQWKDDRMVPGEQSDAYHRLVWGDGAPLRTVLAEPSPTEAGWWPEEGSRLGVLARRVWEPLLQHERTETL